MFLKSLFACLVLAVGVLLSASFVFRVAEPPHPAAGDGAGTTLAKAPISLGNPAAAASLNLLGPQRSGVGAATPTNAERSYRQVLTVGRGDTLGGLLTDAGVPGDEAQGAIRALKAHLDPTRIRQGQEIVIDFLADSAGLSDPTAAEPGRFLGLSMVKDLQNTIIVGRSGDDGFSASLQRRRLTRTLVRAESEIRLSLFVAGRRAGVPIAVLAELIRLYSWDVDFQRDIRAGDSFEVMYEPLFDDTGALVAGGDILFAALTLSGKRHAVYRHATADGPSDYFDENGQSARKALMRTPIDGARLSSGFGKRRHPILGYTKMHKGLDFAASRGTPIYAAGNGTVEAAGWNGAYGKYVRIRHNSEYATAYAHMKRIKTARGRRVTQGQVIGYVGTTGRSTGPHLHYEILKSGRQVNPLRVKMPSGRKLEGADLAAFRESRREIDRKYAEVARPVELAAK